MQHINIIKYIEEKENKDIFQDYNEIKIIVYKYNKIEQENSLEYHFIKKYGHGFADVFLEKIHNKFITNSNQIANRIKNLKQCGYEFSCYNVLEDTLTIVFE